jgi:hypothetical protein
MDSPDGIFKAKFKTTSMMIRPLKIAHWKLKNHQMYIYLYDPGKHILMD